MQRTSLPRRAPHSPLPLTQSPSVTPPQVKYILGLKLPRTDNVQDGLNEIFSNLGGFKWREFCMVRRLPRCGAPLCKLAIAVPDVLLRPSRARVLHGAPPLLSRAWFAVACKLAAGRTRRMQAVQPPACLCVRLACTPAPAHSMPPLMPHLSSLQGMAFIFLLLAFQYLSRRYK